MRSRTTGSLGILALPAVLWFAAASGTTSPAPGTERADGAELYSTHCANCHGTFGAGDGVMAPSLAMVLQDLRYLTTRNNGAFPRDFVIEIIDGRGGRTAHGPEGMPVWGAELARDEPFDAQSEARVTAAINALADYLESIQINPDAKP